MSDKEKLREACAGMSERQRANAFSALMDAIGDGYEVRLYFERVGSADRHGWVGIDVLERDEEEPLKMDEQLTLEEIARAKFNWFARAIQFGRGQAESPTGPTVRPSGDDGPKAA